MSVPKHWSWF